MYHFYSKQLSEKDNSEVNDRYNPDSKTWNESTQKFKKNLVRTSYYGKRDSEFYLDDEENEESSMSFNINVLGDLFLLCEVFKMTVSK